MREFTIFVAVLASLLTYIYVISRQRTPKDPRNYFLARQSVESDQFAVTQTAYALQMATVYPFFVLSFNGTWWIPVVNTAFYAAGIVLFAVFLPRFREDTIRLLGCSVTIHGVIARLHGAPFLRSLTAWMTIIAFSGLTVFEVTWGAVVFRVLFNDSIFMYYLAVATLSLYVILYVWVGGQQANIRTSQFQLLFSYAGLHALIGWIAWQPTVDFRSGPIQIIVPAIIVISVVFLIYRLKNAPSKTSPRFLRYLNALTIASGALMLAAIVGRGNKIVPNFDFTFMSTIADTPNFWLIFASVAVLPLGFQFVDMTNWQRLTALKPTSEGLVKEARAGVVWYLRESPLSWLLPIMAGIACVGFIAPGDQDPWVALLVTLAGAEGLVGLLVAALVFVGVVAIFMSTAEELLTAIGYAFSFDIYKATRAVADRYDVNEEGAVDENDGRLMIMSGRIAFTLATTIVVVAFVFTDQVWGTGQNLIALFLAFFSPLVALAPSLIMPALTGRAAPQAVAALSIIGGAGAGLVLGVWAVCQPTALNEAVAWLASPSSFAIAWIVYLLGWIFGSPVPSPHVASERLAV